MTRPTTVRLSTKTKLSGWTYPGSAALVLWGAVQLAGISIVIVPPPGIAKSSVAG